MPPIRFRKQWLRFCMRQGTLFIDYRQCFCLNRNLSWSVIMWGARWCIRLLKLSIVPKPNLISNINLTCTSRFTLFINSRLSLSIYWYFLGNKVALSLNVNSASIQFLICSPIGDFFYFWNEWINLINHFKFLMSISTFIQTIQIYRLLKFIGVS